MIPEHADYTLPYWKHGKPKKQLFARNGEMTMINKKWYPVIALTVSVLLIWACGGTASTSSAPTTEATGIATETELAVATETQTPLPTATPLGVTTETFIHDPAALSEFAPGQETTQLINDRYGSHYYRQPDLPLTEFPNMSVPLTGTTYEVRPVYVHTTLPGCASTMVAGTPCTVWSTGNHAYVMAYANQWQAAADEKDQWPLDAGEALLFERMDETYLYAKTADTGDMFTFVLSQISLTPPASNLTSGDGTEQYYWWEVPVYAPWGPLDTNLVQIGGIYTAFSYGVDHNFVAIQVSTDPETYATQGVPPPPDAVSHWTAKDDYLPARILGVVPNVGLWLEYADGTVGIAYNTHTWHFQPGFYAVNGLPYPGGALGQ